MKYREWIERGLIERCPPDFRLIVRLQARALKDLRTARATQDLDDEWTYAIAYSAMIRAARGLILAKGYRPKGRDQQQTIIQVAGTILGDRFQTLINTLDLMRRRRWQLIDESVRPIPKLEAASAVKDAEAFVNQILKITRKGNPQLALFM